MYHRGLAKRRVNETTTGSSVFRFTCACAVQVRVVSNGIFIDSSSVSSRRLITKIQFQRRETLSTVYDVVNRF